jgi:hypothetical protein
MNDNKKYISRYTENLLVRYITQTSKFHESLFFQNIVLLHLYIQRLKTIQTQLMHNIYTELKLFITL